MKTKNHVTGDSRKDFVLLSIPQGIAEGNSILMRSMAGFSVVKHPLRESPQAIPFSSRSMTRLSAIKPAYWESPEVILGHKNKNSFRNNINVSHWRI